MANQAAQTQNTMPKREAESRLPLGDGTLNPDGPPLYQQIYNAIRALIDHHGDESLGWGLPTEDQLGAHYQVSKITVRKALQLLERDGMIARRRAKTPVIVRHANKPAVLRTIGTIDDMFQHAADTERQIERFETTSEGEACQSLGLEPGANIKLAVTTQSVASERIGYSRIYFPPDVSASLTRAGLEQTSYLVFPIVEEITGQRIVKADVTLGAGVADAAQADLIGCDLNAPLVVINVVFRVVDGRAILYSKNYYRADRYTIAYTLGRSPAHDTN